MATRQDHEHRITNLEGRADKTDEVVGSHSESLHKLWRCVIENRLGMNLLLDHFGLPRVTQEQVDEVLDAE